MGDLGGLWVYLGKMHEKLAVNARKICDRCMGVMGKQWWGLLRERPQSWKAWTPWICRTLTSQQVLSQLITETTHSRPACTDGGDHVKQASPNHPFVHHQEFSACFVQCQISLSLFRSLIVKAAFYYQHVNKAFYYQHVNKVNTGRNTTELSNYFTEMKVKPPWHYYPGQPK